MYLSKLATEDSFSWHALLPSERFYLLHSHPRQDEYSHVKSDASDLDLDGEHSHAGEGDLVCMPRCIPRGIYNNTDHDVTRLFWVIPTGKVVE
ncbi:MAG: quercetin dioxygenase-like cupin family protein [Granulosicoccus sp.]